MQWSLGTAYKNIVELINKHCVWFKNIKQTCRIEIYHGSQCSLWLAQSYLFVTAAYQIFTTICYVFECGGLVFVWRTPQWSARVMPVLAVQTGSVVAARWQDERCLAQPPRTDLKDSLYVRISKCVTHHITNSGLISSQQLSLIDDAA